MKSAGKVISTNGARIVLSGKSVLKAGTKLFDGGGKAVGTVLEYFGPVSNPYLLASAKIKADQYTGKELFY